MTTVVDGDFEWDSEKSGANAAKHGVSFEEAAVALASDPNEYAVSDPLDPLRTHSLVLSPRDRVLFVVTTEVRVRTRIISARKAEPHEQRTYFEGSR